MQRPPCARTEPSRPQRQVERPPPSDRLRSGRHGQAPPAAEVRPATPPAPASRPAHTIGGALTGARGLGTVRLRAARPSVAQSVPVLGGVQGPFGAFCTMAPHTTFPRAGRRGGAKASRGAREPQMATLTSRNEGVAGGRFGDGACAFFFYFFIIRPVLRARCPPRRERTAARRAPGEARGGSRHAPIGARAPPGAGGAGTRVKECSNSRCAATAVWGAIVAQWG